jgi:hypothetical protein
MGGNARLLSLSPLLVSDTPYRADNPSCTLRRGNSHIGNPRKKLPFHTRQFATLEIDTEAVTKEPLKSHHLGGFFHAANFNRWTNLAISPLERLI